MKFSTASTGSLCLHKQLGDVSPYGREGAATALVTRKFCDVSSRIILLANNAAFQALYNQFASRLPRTSVARIMGRHYPQ